MPRTLRRLAVLAVLVALAVPAAAFAGTTETYVCSHTTEQSTAPGDAVSARVTVEGAGGPVAGADGTGDSLVVEMPVTPGQQFDVVAGCSDGFGGEAGGGTGGFVGGLNGGGGSYIAPAGGALADAYAVAGGGGGHGGSYFTFGSGGNAGDMGGGAAFNPAGAYGSGSYSGGQGGQSGDLGGAGGDGGFANGPHQVNGGAGQAAAGGQGGAGGDVFTGLPVSGGGGGGGWVGGGGGGAGASDDLSAAGGGGGGGGSSHVATGVTQVSSQATVTTDGSVTIEYTEAPGVLGITPASYDFGSHPLDPSATQHVTKTFTIANTGGFPLTVTGIATGGSPDFSISSNPCDITLAVGDSCTFDVDFVALPDNPFSPGSGGGYGPQSGSAIVYWSTSDGTMGHMDGAPLSADVATAPAATVTPSSNDFGAHAVGTRTDQTFTVTNTGGSPLDVHSINDNSSEDFDAGPVGDDHCSGQTLAAGDTCTFTWSFTPAADAGAKSTSLQVDSNDPDAPTLVAVTGQALNPSHMSITPDPLDFTTVPTGDTAERTVTVTNSGDVAMNVGQAALSFTNADQYALVAGQDDCSHQTVAGGATCTIDVRYSPTADGDAFALLTVPSDATEGQDEVNVLGMGQTPGVPTVSSPTDGETVTDTTPSVVVATQPGMSVHLLVDHNDDEGYQTAGSDGTATFTLAAPLGDGAHQLVVFARSGPHTTSAERTSTFTVDTTAPTGPAVTAGPQGATSQHTAKFEFSGEPGASFACAIDGGAFAPCTSPQSYQALGEGQHTFRVRQADAAGHVGAVSTQTFAVSSAATTPAPAPAPAPAPKPAATAKPAGKPAPAADAKSLALVVAATGTTVHAKVPVGCRLDDGRLATCIVRAYAGHQRVGTGATRFTGGRLGTVNIKLSGRELRRMRRVGGVRLTYRAVATTATGTRLAARGRSRVLPLRAAAVPQDGLFRSGGNTMIGYGRRFVASLAAQLDGAKSVTCVGHTDSVGAAAANRRLGLARAKTVCRALRKAGVRVGLHARSAGERGPRATNRTGAGRTLNRRVELLVRYR